MLNEFFTISTTETTIAEFLICTFVSLLFGVLIALIHMYKNTCTKNFILTLIILPAIVQAVILLVNGQLGTGIAVMGAFSLVRFRSAEGNAREITSLFLAMAIGLATGTGYLGIAGLLLLGIGAVIILVQSTPFGNRQENARTLKISVPEDLDYEGLFDDLLATYTKSHKLLKVRTSNMGSLFELEYLIFPQKGISTKKLLDDIRCRNGNLPVALHYLPTDRETL